MDPLLPADEAAVALLRLLKAHGYDFKAPTRDTFHINRLRRPLARSATLADIFGWTRRIRERDMLPAISGLMQAAGLISAAAFGRVRSKLACARLGDALVLHSSLANTGGDAVFLGPDTYRFVDFLRRQAHRLPKGGRIVDIGSGTGAGALAIAALRPDLRLVLSDINPVALRLARINLAAAEVQAEFIESDGLANITGRIDGVLANPPYLGGGIGRTYRNGGGTLGSGLSIDWVLQAAARIEPEGTILLYTGSAIVDGLDTVRSAVEPSLLAADYAVDYQEVDPDIFSRVLWLPAYWNVNRIAAVTMAATRPRIGPTARMPSPYG